MITLLPTELSAKLQDNPEAKILVSDADYPSISCPNCNDMKSIGLFIPKHKPTKSPTGGKQKYFDGQGWMTGDIEWAFCPVCQGDASDEFYIKTCGLSSADLSIMLNQFKIDKFPEKKQAYETAIQLISLNDETAGFVTFYGEYGVGKTHILKGITNALRKIKVYSNYTTLADLIALIRENVANGNTTETIIAHYRKIKALMIDEVDKIHLTGWTKEVIFRLIDTRYNENSHLLTVLACNTSPGDFPVELGYIASRMTGGILVNIGGVDLRPAVSIRDNSE